MARLSEVLKEAKGGEFVLVQLPKGAAEPVYDEEGQLLVFSTGEEAGFAAHAWSEKLGVKVQPRRAVDKEWRERETKRMKDGSYVPLPWHEEAFWKEMSDVHKGHFPHVSLRKTALIAFTEDEFKGSADLQTPMKPGRYLERYFSEKLSKHVIRDLCCIFAKKFEDNKLTFADTAEEIEEVYLEGPTSCMSKEKGSYSAPVHPTTAYAAGDLQVAYLRREGRIVARVLVWPEKKTYNTIYGDKGRLEALLAKEGYKYAPPYGARIAKIKKKDGSLFRYVCPHVDNIGWVYDDGEFLRAGKAKRKDGEGIEVPGGGGLSEQLGFKCAPCNNDSFAQRHVISYYVGETTKTSTMCKECAKSRLVNSGTLGGFIEKSCAVELADKTWGWSKQVKDGNIGLCAGSGKYWLMGQMIMMPDGQRWSPHHFQVAGHHCAHCGGGYKRTDKVCPRCNDGAHRSELRTSISSVA